METEIILELTLESGYDNHEEAIMAALDGWGGLWMSAGQVSVSIPEDQAKELSTKIINLDGVTVTKAYIDYL